jgi:hypothetical protein
VPAEFITAARPRAIGDAYECVRILIFLLSRLASHLSRDAMARMELRMFSKGHRPGRIIWHDIVSVAAFALALGLTFWTYQHSDLLPTHWSIDQSAPYSQRERAEISKHREWTTVWPTVVRFDRPPI